ncbi:MAG TPA: hypothetical protein QF611_01965 [Pseudomonadales bacterium]|nr:hypothetical protein [Pseudomonadales bacterium]HJP49776.1 hypothetical protein [Pseudomonadales bacterium]
MMAKELQCWNCGTSLTEIPLPISRHNNCPNCFEVLHCCRLCRLYAPGRPGDCEHERAEPPAIKESANFCDYFRPVHGAFKTKDGHKQEAAASDFDLLFTDNESDNESDNKESEEGVGFDIDPDNDNPLDDLFDD